jgi:hypothetical protein
VTLPMAANATHPTGRLSQTWAAAASSWRQASPCAACSAVRFTLFTRVLALAFVFRFDPHLLVGLVAQQVPTTSPNSGILTILPTTQLIPRPSWGRHWLTRALIAVRRATTTRRCLHTRHLRSYTLSHSIGCGASPWARPTTRLQLTRPLRSIVTRAPW